jgi:UDP-N-acetylglucosamine 2-epimerase (non-hydrolysing)
MKLTVLFGTRPETIKCAPLIKEGKRRGHDVKIVFTGQHREMALPLLDFFGLKPDVDLALMRPGQTLSTLSALMLAELEKDPTLKDTDAVLVQGDTTSAFVGAYWAFLNRIPVIHLEAGLRTFDLSAPFPEEGNRQLIGRIANLHLAPTKAAYQSLIKEAINPELAHVIGNTGIDALEAVVGNRPTMPADVAAFVADSPMVLITGHRRENFGQGFENICQAIKQMAQDMPEVRFVYPVHLNPAVQGVVNSMLSGLSNVMLTTPADYLPFVALQARADVILTDSGGIQEEAPTLRKPVLVMRESTERPEGVAAGFAKLVGTDIEAIRLGVHTALQEGCQGKGGNPYGDGKASARAWDIFENRFPLKG